MNECSIVLTNQCKKRTQTNKMESTSHLKGEPTVAAEDKKISDIIYLNPFQNKVVSCFSKFLSVILCPFRNLFYYLLIMQKKEFLVTVTIKKIDKSWCYNSCKKCLHTAIPHGDSYKCIDLQCGTIGVPDHRSDDIFLHFLLNSWMF